MPNKKWDYVMASIETEWPILLGDAYETLNLFTSGKGIGDEGSEYLVEMYHPQEILKDDEKRNVIIKVLPEEFAIELAKIIGIKYSDSNDLYSKLKTIDYKKSEKYFLQYFGIDILPKPKEEKIIGVGEIDIDVLESPLRCYQRQIVSDVRKVFNSGSTKCMIHMPTGSGKTRTAMYIITHMMNDNEPFMVLWLAYSKELCNQASEEFTKMWSKCGNRRINRYNFYGNSDCEFPTSKVDGIIITTLGKIIEERRRNDTAISMLSDKIDLVVFDEAHQIVAPQYSSIVNNVICVNKGAKLIGLTATPGRTWNDPEEDEKLSKYFRKNIVEIDTGSDETPNAMLTRMGFLSEVIWRPCECSTPLCKNDIEIINKLREDDEIPVNILNKISNDAKRNIRIVDEIERLLSEGRKRILLFATSVSHARIMTGITRIVAKKYDCSVNCIEGNTDKGIREDILSKFSSNDSNPQIICNYDILTTGYDCPKIDAGIIARPTKSVVLFSQMVGRMIRGVNSGGTKDAIIVTVVDVSLPGFKDAHENWRDVWI